MGLAVKKVLCRVVFGGNGARGSRATWKKPAGVKRRSAERDQIEPSCGPTTKLPIDLCKFATQLSRFLGSRTQKSDK